MPRGDEYDDDDRYDAGDDEYDDYDDEPRPKSRKGLAAARDIVAAPAILLMIVGVLGLVAAAGQGAMNMAGPGARNQARPPGAARNNVAYQAGRMSAVLISCTWGAVVFFGGLQLKNLRSRGFVTFATVLAMLPCNVCFLLGLPFGIWAMVAMNNETVKRVY